MGTPRAIVFDLGNTLIGFPERYTDWEGDWRWACSYDHLSDSLPEGSDVIRVGREAFVNAMAEAEAEYWRRVAEERTSGPPTGLAVGGFGRLGLRPGKRELLAVLNGYARAVEGWAVALPGARETLLELRADGYLLGLLSNTWWAPAWHDADLARHGLADLLDEVVYTSDLACSKPHPSVFLEAASRLGVPPANCVMVGDDLLCDVSGAREAGMRAVWVSRTGGDSSEPEGVEPDAEIGGLRELPSVLRQWGGNGKDKDGSRFSPR